jgi:hypothetical protein
VEATSTKYSAAASAAGYLFQARLALAEALRFAYSDSGIEIAIEKFDDVSFEIDGTAIELLQTKHHVKKFGDLTDLSPDLWKTLRIWSDKVRADPSLPSRVRFTLVTTATAPAGSATEKLRPSLVGSLRDVDAALTQLMSASASSQSKALAPMFEAFNSLALEMQRSLLNAVDIIDQSPSLTGVEKVIDERLKMIAPRGKIETAREQIEGWWWGRIAKSLQTSEVGTISVLELEARLDDIREVMRRDALPVELAETELDDEQLLALDEMVFVKQLQLVGLGPTRIDLAKRDFYRASTQRSRWTRENLVFDGEVGRFERTLIEEWQPRFHAMCENLADESFAAKVRQAGRDLYQWVEADARFSFRNLTHRFLSVGSYNMLANDARVGWHRDFRQSVGKAREV